MIYIISQKIFTKKLKIIMIFKYITIKIKIFMRKKFINLEFLQLSKVSKQIFQKTFKISRLI